MLRESSHSSNPISRRPSINSAWIAGLFISSGLSHFTIAEPRDCIVLPCVSVTRNQSSSSGSIANHLVWRMPLSFSPRIPSTKGGHSRMGVVTMRSTESIMGLPYSMGLTMVWPRAHPFRAYLPRNI